jgi:hypothetical protein
MLFNFDFILTWQGLTISRCYPPSLESGIEPEDDESEENLEEVADSEATKDDEDETEDVEGFIVKCRKHAAEELIDTAESSPRDHQYDDAHHIVLVEADGGRLC